MTEKYLQDRMRKYSLPINPILELGGLLIAATGGLTDSPMTLASGVFLFFAGSVHETIGYLRGYFNERLQIEDERLEQLKSNKLEKKVQK